MRGRVVFRKDTPSWGSKTSPASRRCSPDRLAGRRPPWLEWRLRLGGSKRRPPEGDLSGTVPQLPPGGGSVESRKAKRLDTDIWEHIRCVMCNFYPKQ